MLTVTCLKNLIGHNYSPTCIKIIRYEVLLVECIDYFISLIEDIISSNSIVCLVKSIREIDITASIRAKKNEKINSKKKQIQLNITDISKYSFAFGCRLK